MEVFATILFLLCTYFITGIALIQGYFPGTSKWVREKNGFIRPLTEYGKVMLYSLAVSLVLTGLMFYFFIYPSYDLQ